MMDHVKSSISCKTLIITSYPVIRNELNKSNSLLSLHFSCCVLDEGHFIRNHTSQLHHAVCNIQANHRIVLSGTPIQNCLEDIYAIFQFIAPGYFGDYDSFYDFYIKPLSQAYHKRNRALRRSANERIEALNQAVRPFLLRRTKEDVHLELPEKTISDIICPMTDCQESVYIICFFVFCSLKAFREWINSQLADEAARKQILQQSIAIATHPYLCTYLDSFLYSIDKSRC